MYQRPNARRSRSDAVVAYDFREKKKQKVNKVDPYQKKTQAGRTVVRDNFLPTPGEVKQCVFLTELLQNCENGVRTDPEEKMEKVGNLTDHPIVFNLDAEQNEENNKPFGTGPTLLVNAQIDQTSGSGMIDFVPTDGCGLAATVHTAALQKVEMFYDSFSSDMNDLLDDHREIETIAETIWTERFRPRDVSQLLGNRKKIILFRKWLSTWHKSKKSVCCIIGPPGVGKTTLIYAVCSEDRYNIREINASDTRTKIALMFHLHAACQYRPLGGPQLMLLEELDGSTEDEGSAVSGLIEFINSTKPTSPIVCTTNTMPKMLRDLKASKHVQMIYMDPLQPNDLINLGNRIILNTDANISRNLLIQMVNQSGGDARRLVNDMQWYCKIDGASPDPNPGASCTKRGDVSTNNFQTARQIFLGDGTNAHSLFSDNSNLFTGFAYHNYPSNIAKICSERPTKPQHNESKNQQVLLEISSLADCLSFCDFVAPDGHWKPAPTIQHYTVEMFRASLKPLSGRQGAEMTFPSQLMKQHNTKKDFKNQQQMGMVGRSIPFTEIPLCRSILRKRALDATVGVEGAAKWVTEFSTKHEFDISDWKTVAKPTPIETTAKKFTISLKMLRSWTHWKTSGQGKRKVSLRQKQMLQDLAKDRKSKN